MTIRGSGKGGRNQEMALAATLELADDRGIDLICVGTDGTDGPTIDITNCCEGLEGAELNVCSGDITINASDDCLNAANSDLTDYDFTMTISGGAIDAYTSGGDGFDSNGELTITGGTVIVWTANTADNEPLDADGTPCREDAATAALRHLRLNGLWRHAGQYAEQPDRRGRGFHD